MHHDAAIIDARAPGAPRGLLIDLATGQPIRKARWADLRSGEYECFATDAAGVILRGPDGRHLIRHGRTRLKWVPTVNFYRPPLVQAARNAAEEEAHRPPERRTRTTARRFLAPLLDVPCQHYGCGRPASWEVSDEVELPPVRRGAFLYPRGRTVATRCYCTRHYQPPRLLDAKGEMIQEFSNIAGRPE